MRCWALPVGIACNSALPAAIASSPSADNQLRVQMARVKKNSQGNRTGPGGKKLPEGKKHFFANKKPKGKGKAASPAQPVPLNAEWVEEHNKIIDLVNDTDGVIHFALLVCMVVAPTARAPDIKHCASRAGYPVCGGPVCGTASAVLTTVPLCRAPARARRREVP